MKGLAPGETARVTHRVISDVFRAMHLHTVAEHCGDFCFVIETKKKSVGCPLIQWFSVLALGTAVYSGFSARQSFF